ncbi:tetratricopeptide repeat protein [Treponema brennaborense]|uniref:Tetratricopeptide TPR_1 repeat-containing protein n=1 Tax=Treponema brennaborense (strain DSM 12168 / CIP 105900 / DD5/3) TaxID=906968 RepID=F4LIC3_TREBD|nr:tetratricopeptide repeat protein [Treponema brennaborense]AEE16164.1 Tetratricopeptide TPR_1 repeat-containing protein [Treponema brennaborense DSM 12168]
MKESPEMLNTRAIEFASRGEYPEAIACFKRALTMEHQNYLLWYNLGVTYRDAGKLLQAKDAVLTAFKMEPDDEEVLESLAHICFMLNEQDEALTFCAAGLALNRKNAHLWNNSGVIYFTRAEYDSACEAFEQAVTVDPTYYDALYNLRDTYKELGNKAGAEECTRRLKDLPCKGDFYA